MSDKKILNTNSFVVLLPFMRDDLDLDGSEFIIYAIINGFSADGESYFTGSLDYLMKWTGKSRTTVINNLKSLVDKNYIIKVSETIKGVVFNKYKVNLALLSKNHSVQKLCGGGTEIIPPVQKLNGGGTETVPGGTKTVPGGTKTVPNNIIYNKDYNKDINIDNTIVLSKQKSSILQNTENNNSNINKISNTNNTNLFKLDPKLDKKKGNSKKQQEIVKMFNLIEQLFNNEQIKEPKLCEVIKKFLQSRIGRIDSAALTYEAWESQLQLLIDISENDWEYAYDVVGNSLRANYRVICYTGQAKSKQKNFNSGGYNKPMNSFDTARNNKMDKGFALLSKEEKTNYVTTKLATDENGNPLEF